MALSLYTVEITREVVVVAESREAAEDVAHDERHDIESSCDPDFTASRMTAFPPDWDESSRPWHALDGGDPRADWTIGQWREAIATEDAEAKRAAEFDARQLAMPGVD